MNKDVQLTLLREAMSRLTLPDALEIDHVNRRLLGKDGAPAHERSVAITLKLIDGQMGPTGSTLLFPIANDIVFALMALEELELQIMKGDDDD